MKLQPLDPQLLDAVAREDDVDEGMDFTLHHRMSDIRTMIKEDEDWGLGVEGLMRGGGGIPALIRRTKPMRTLEERMGSDDWFIEFAWFQFGDLSLRPSPGGIVGVYAFGKCLKLFQIMGCRKNWPVLVRWVWEYGNQMDMRKSKQEAQKASQRQRRRVEKPLLTQVLRPAKFKAQYEKKSVAKDSAAISDVIDVIMNDADAIRPLCDTAPDAAISSGPGTRDEQRMPTATVEDVNISALRVVD